MADNNTATAVADDEWEVKPPAKKPGGDDEWSVSPPPAAPNPKTGAGMEDYSLQQAHSMFTPNQVVGNDAHGQPIYDKPPNPIDKAASEHTTNQVRLGAAENRAMQSPTPFTNASSLFAPVTAAKQIIGAKVGSRIGEAVDPEYGPLVGGVLGGGVATISPRSAGSAVQRVLRGPGGSGEVSINPVKSVTRELEASVPRNEPPGARDEMYNEKGESLMSRGAEQERIDAENARNLQEIEKSKQQHLADVGKHEMLFGQEQADAVARDQAAREAVPVSKSSGPYRGPSSVRLSGDVPANSSTRLPPSIAPGPAVPPGGLPSEATGPTLFEPGTSTREPGRVGNEGSAARFPNKNAYELAKKGSREAIMTLGRRGIEPPPNSRYIMGDVDTDRVVYNPREVTRFEPSGEAIRDMSVPEKGGRARIVTPNEIHGTSVDFPSQGPTEFQGENKRVAPGASPTGTERRSQAMQDYHQAITTTPPGQQTPGEKLAQDTRAAQAGKPSGITEGDARRFIAGDKELYAKFRELDASANKGDRAAYKQRDEMLVKAMQDMKKIQ
jgi:hypothetical protein